MTLKNALNDGGFMRMCEMLVAASAALIISGNEAYGIGAFVLSMIGLLVRTSIEMSQKQQKVDAEQISKNIQNALLEEAKSILNRNIAVMTSQKNFN